MEYQFFLKDIEKALSKPKYINILKELEEEFYKTHISIKEIEQKENIYNYYFERLLNISINSKNLIDILYENNDISKKTFSIFKEGKLSIFILKKVKKDNCINLIDMFSNEKIKVKYSPHWDFLPKNDMIQSFLYKINEEYELSLAGISHHKDTKVFIKNEIKNIKSNEDDFLENKTLILNRMFRNFVIYGRYKNKKAIDIYKLNM